MYEKEAIIRNQLGLHGKAACYWVQEANNYKSRIWVEKKEQRVNAKSLLGILSLGIIGGNKIKIIANGADEMKAVDFLVKLTENELLEF